MASLKDRERLRRLAARYAEIAAGKAMDERREVWRRSNQLEERTVPFRIEDNGKLLADCMPGLECEGEPERGYEKTMLSAITNFEVVDDDHVIPPHIRVPWIITRPALCEELKKIRIPDIAGRELGTKTNKPLSNLENFSGKLQRGEFRVFRDETMRLAESVRNIFGDILPVKIETAEIGYWGHDLAHKIINLMGMDNFYMAMVDQPENLHRLLDFLTTEAVEFNRWLETEGLLHLNNREFLIGSGNCVYSDQPPFRKIDKGERILLNDMWGTVEAQEAIGISPKMYEEFIFLYLKRIADQFGLIYYGCCEPVHKLWPVIKKFSNLRKITISPWCDQGIMAEALGRNYVFSRKPRPLKLAGEVFDPRVFEEDIRETIDIAKNNIVEIIFRDTCTLNGAMRGRIAEACKIVRRIIDRESGSSAMHA